jgi:hypothetical protein
MGKFEERLWSIIRNFLQVSQDDAGLLVTAMQVGPYCAPRRCALPAAHGVMRTVVCHMAALPDPPFAASLPAFPPGPSPRLPAGG